MESLSLDGKAIDEMTEDELTERLRYFSSDRLFSTACRRMDNQELQELAALFSALI